MDSKDKVTIDDIARELGISKTTVSRAISGKGRIGADTVNRVQAYIKAIGYHPSAIAKSLAKSKSYNIAFVIPADSENFEYSFFQKCMLGVSGYATAQGYDVVVCVAQRDDISSLSRLINNQKIDGAILARTVENDAVMQYLMHENIPFVAAGTVSEKNVVQIDNDHAAACKDMTDKLIHGGVVRPVLLGGNLSYTVNRKRLEGYRAALSEAGIEIADRFEALDIASVDDIEKAVDGLMAENPDCLVCMDDSYCMQALGILNRKGIAIPQDIKVASFYDSSFLRHYKPPVSAIHFNVKELGEACAKALISMIRTDERARNELLPYEPVMRESTK